MPNSGAKRLSGAVTWLLCLMSVTLVTKQDSAPERGLDVESVFFAAVFKQRIIFSRIK
jgi:hypothetical protein